MTIPVSTPVITYVAALSCEVKALLDLHRAKKVCDKPFTLFLAESEDCRVEVLVSGIGALSMASAVGWLGGHRPAEQRVWLNIGAAGHASKALGEILRVNVSSDILNERKHFPPLVARSGFVSDAVLSVNAPTSDYPAEGAMDMEAYAFFNAATRFSSSELVQALKVVSDNPEHGLENLNAQTISALLEPHTTEINDFAFALLELAKIVVAKQSSSESDETQTTEVNLPSVRLTHSQRHQLNSTIKKLNSLDVMSQELKASIDNAASFDELSKVLKAQLESCVPHIAAVK